MTTHKDIRGTHITTVTSDPPAPVNGQMWYNSTDQVMKGLKILNVGAWATGGSLNTGRNNSASAAADNTAALVSGGNPNLAITESYNGSSWTEVNDLNTARDYLCGSGTSTSALDWGGNPAVAITESWNGSSWTEVNDLNTARGQLGGAGDNNTSAIAFGGQGVVANCETWNGTVWTEVNDLNTARDYLAGGGTVTSALAFGGEPVSPAVQAYTESWNGSSWTEVSDMNTGKSGPFGAGESNTAALASGGEIPTGAGGGVAAITELWNGSGWTEVADMSTARGVGAISNSGTTSSAINIGGNSTPKADTEEWSGTTPSTVTFTAS